MKSVRALPANDAIYEDMDPCEEDALYRMLSMMENAWGDE